MFPTDILWSRRDTILHHDSFSFLFSIISDYDFNFINLKLDLLIHIKTGENNV